MNSETEIVFQKDNIGIGKRKQAIARVFLIPGEGSLTINKIPGENLLLPKKQQFYWYQMF